MAMPTPIGDDDAARERSLKEAGEVMLMIEGAIRRTDQALDRLASEGGPAPRVRASLARARRDLEALRRRIHQEVYLHSDTLPFE